MRDRASRLRQRHLRSQWPLGVAVAALARRLPAGFRDRHLILLALLFRTGRSVAAVALGLGMGGFLGDLIDQLPDGRLTQFIVFQPFGLGLSPFNFSEVGIGALVLYAAWTALRRLRGDRSARA